MLVGFTFRLFLLFAASEAGAQTPFATAPTSADLQGQRLLGKPTLVPGPDVIVGNLPSLQQFGDAGTQVGLALGTESCNNGQVNVDWFALPNNDHPVIPQNLYRMSGGADNTQRFEQIGQSWLKHAFTAASEDNCGFGCNDVFGEHLGAGCSDLYSTTQNGTKMSSVPVHGSIHSQVFSPEERTLGQRIIPAMFTTASPTVSALKPMT
jgi:hypothetical protein